MGGQWQRSNCWAQSSQRVSRWGADNVPAGFSRQVQRRTMAPPLNVMARLLWCMRCSSWLPDRRCEAAWMAGYAPARMNAHRTRHADTSMLCWFVRMSKGGAAAATARRGLVAEWARCTPGANLPLSIFPAMNADSGKASIAVCCSWSGGRPALRPRPRPLAALGPLGRQQSLGIQITLHLRCCVTGSLNCVGCAHERAPHSLPSPGAPERGWWLASVHRQRVGVQQ